MPLFKAIGRLLLLFQGENFQQRHFFAETVVTESHPTTHRIRVLSCHLHKKFIIYDGDGYGDHPHCLHGHSRMNANGRRNGFCP